MSQGAPASAAALEVTGVSKSFFGTPVLRDVSLRVERGEVHCLAGGNGSGKSTLVKIISGVYHADAGTIAGPRSASVDARHMSAHAAGALGIHTVHQESSVFQSLSVAENLMLGRGFPMRWGRIDRRRAARAASEALERFRIPARPSDLVQHLPPAVQTMIAIARALPHGEHADGAVLVLDEPTATLATDQVDMLLAAIRGYAADGEAIVMVTHRLEEVLGIADTVTVLRDGERVASTARSELTREGLIDQIVGRRIEEQVFRAAAPVTAAAPVLEIKDLWAGPLRGVDLVVRPREVVGVASLVGGGASELTQAVFGLHRPDAGAVSIGGVPAGGFSQAELIRRGTVLIPPDRARDASFGPMSVRENVSAGSVRTYWRRGRIASAVERSDARALIRDFNVRPADSRATMSSLSGGNQQKVVMARSLRRKPALILLDEPSQGVDVGARLEIHQHIRSAVDAGAGALLATSDLDELLRLSDRVVVLSGGRIVADRAADEFDRALVVSLMNTDPSNAEGSTK